MTSRLFLILLAICFISFTQVHLQPDFNKDKTCKEVADSVFLANQKADTLSFQATYENSETNQPRVAVLIGDLFHNKQKNAVVAYSTSDTSMNLKLYEFNDSKWNILQEQSVETGSIGFSEEFVFFDNLNDDKTKELIILTSVWQMRSGANLKAFFLKGNKLVEIKKFDYYPNPEYDEKTKKIYSYIGNGCADMIMFFAESVIENDSLKMLYEIQCDCCQESEDTCQLLMGKLPPFKVPYDDAYKYVFPHYQNFLKDKLKTVKEE